MRTLILFLALMGVILARAQNSTVELKELAVPASPAFILLDATPSVIQTPNTPKSFILGVAQSFQESGSSFPQEYSAEFTPYWWIMPSKRSIYSLTGIPAPNRSPVQPLTGTRESHFAGMRFSGISVGFFNKDMVPDSIASTQKIVSAGFHSTILTFHQKGYAERMQQLVNDWHTQAQKEIDENIDLITRIAQDTSKADELISQFKPSGTLAITDNIRTIINAKPLFSWDVAAAYATYGIGDSSWKTGRLGVWTTLSYYRLLKGDLTKQDNHYLSINLSLRYLKDDYSRNAESNIIKTDFIDAGGKIAYETDQFSFGIESICRFSGGNDPQYRTVGLFNYRIAENIYVNAAFGENFDLPNKLVALFGINLGFGSESIHLDDR